MSFFNEIHNVYKICILIEYIRNITVSVVINFNSVITAQYPVTDPGFPRGGCANPRGDANILFDHFFPKTA